MTEILSLLRDSLLSFIVALVFSLIITPIVKFLVYRAKLIDQPNYRKMHTKPVSTMGGIAIFFGFTAGVLVHVPLEMQTKGIIYGAMFITLVGIVDDIISLRPIVKIAGQVISGLIISYFNIKISYMTNLFGNEQFYYLNMLSIPLTVGWVIVVTNTMNIIDGLDGLAGGIAVIVAVTFFIIGIIEIRTKVILYILAALMGATIGFLKYNIHPASIFMGDTGSMLLGFVLASVSIMGYFKSVTLATLIVPVVALGVPIFDTIFAVIRRHRESAPIFKPDRKHLHHQFIDLGLTQKQTVFILYIISSFLGLSAVFLTYVEDTYALLILIFLGTLFSFGTKRIKWLKEKIDFEKEKMNEEKVIKNKIEENNAE